MSTRRGFSLLELTLIVALLAMISVATIGISSRSIQKNRLRTARTMVTQSIRRAQTRAQNNINAAKWGVYFCSVPTCSDTTLTSVILFNRSSYGSFQSDNDHIYELGDNTSFSGTLYTDTIAGSIGLVFDQLTGLPNASGTLVIQAGDELQSVSVNPKGMVQM